MGSGSKASKSEAVNAVTWPAPRHLLAQIKEVP